ncbi:MAG: hypothetical protein ACLTSX_11425 [Collinsella sp.]
MAIPAEPGARVFRRFGGDAHRGFEASELASGAHRIRVFVYASFALLTACVGIVLVGMLTEDYTLAYVVSELSRDR